MDSKNKKKIKIWKIKEKIKENKAGICTVNTSAEKDTVSMPVP